MRRALLAATAAVVLLSSCQFSNPFAPARMTAPPTVDSECVGGMRFIHDYSAVAARYDPRYESDRQELAATTSLATARNLLHDLANVLDAYDAELGALKAPADFADGLAVVVGANRDMREGALQLAGSALSSADQAAFQDKVNTRHAAVHDLQLQVAFVSSECG